MIIWVYFALLIAMTFWAYTQRLSPTPLQKTFLDKETQPSDLVLWGFLCILLTSAGTNAALDIKTNLPEPIKAALGLHLPLCMVFVLFQKWPLWLTPSLRFEPLKNPLRVIGLNFLRWWAPLRLLYAANTYLMDWGAHLGYWKPLDTVPVFQSYLAPGTPLPWITTVGLTVILLAPLSEEYLFRGILLPFLRHYITPSKAALLCALLFACAHRSIESFLPLCVLGYILSRLYERYQNLWIPIGLHSLFNANEFILALSAIFTN